MSVFIGEIAGALSRALAQAWRSGEALKQGWHIHEADLAHLQAAFEEAQRLGGSQRLPLLAAYQAYEVLDHYISGAGAEHGLLADAFGLPAHLALRKLHADLFRDRPFSLAPRPSLGEADKRPSGLYDVWSRPFPAARPETWYSHDGWLPEGAQKIYSDLTAESRSLETRYFKKNVSLSYVCLRLLEISRELISKAFELKDERPDVSRYLYQAAGRQLHSKFLTQGEHLMKYDLHAHRALLETRLMHMGYYLAARGVPGETQPAPLTGRTWDAIADGAVKILDRGDPVSGLMVMTSLIVLAPEAIYEYMKAPQQQDHLARAYRTALQALFLHEETFEALLKETPRVKVIGRFRLAEEARYLKATLEKTSQAVQSAYAGVVHGLNQGIPSDLSQAPEKLALHAVQVANAASTVKHVYPDYAALVAGRSGELLMRARKLNEMVFKGRRTERVLEAKDAIESAAKGLEETQREITAYRNAGVGQRRPVRKLRFEDPDGIIPLYAAGSQIPHTAMMQIHF